MILVTGGVGYIGRHVARLLGATTIDRRGGDIRADLLDATVDWSRFDAVIHCAGRISVEESVAHPELYRRDNVETLRFFEGARRIVFSSSAAVYGEPARLPIREDDPLRPVNPYGETKLEAERRLRGATILRYFNAAGSDEDHEPETHLIPRVLRAARTGEPVTLFGDAVRDYVHVEDLAEAHARALQKPGVYNLGSGRGTTTREVVDTAERVTGRKIRVVAAPPRPGDPAALVADISKARRELGWEPRRTLEEILADAWAR